MKIIVEIEWGMYGGPVTLAVDYKSELYMRIIKTLLMLLYYPRLSINSIRAILLQLITLKFWSQINSANS